MLNRYGQTVLFSGLRFGVTVTRGDGSQEAHVFPPQGVECRRTDQDLLTTVMVRWRPDEQITVDAWIENGGVRVEGQHTLTVPRPPQPHPSRRHGLAVE